MLKFDYGNWGTKDLNFLNGYHIYYHSNALILAKGVVLSTKKYRIHNICSEVYFPLGVYSLSDFYMFFFRLLEVYLMESSNL